MSWKKYLRQLFIILGKYDICFIVPDSLRISIQCKYPASRIETFNEDYFSNVYKYSELLLDLSFYKKFSNYEYMLIYQTDAFVFQDKLTTFVEEGYDFIGAPVAKEYWAHLNNRIGNGGFALRKISTVCDFLKNKDKYIKDWREEYPEENPVTILQYEDMFFAYCMEKNIEHIHIPTVERALDFSIDYNINGIFNNLSQHIPFGCHRWYKYRCKEWWGIISRYGYELSDEVKIKYFKNNYDFEKRILIEGICAKSFSKNQIKRIRNSFYSDKEVIVWGYGSTGKKVEQVLRAVNIPIYAIVDSDSNVAGAVRPSRGLFSSNTFPIIVCSKMYQNEIMRVILDLRLTNRLYKWDDLVMLWIKELDIYNTGAIC